MCAVCTCGRVHVHACFSRVTERAEGEVKSTQLFFKSDLAGV